MQWVTWINLFDFDIRHIPSAHNKPADALSRKRPGPSDALDQQFEGDLDDFVDAQINTTEFATVPDIDETLLTEETKWSELSKQIATYLIHHKFPPNLNAQQRRRFQVKAAQHVLVDHRLWRINRRTRERKRVVDDMRVRKVIMAAAHCQFGHKGIKTTYDRCSKGYWWSGMWEDAKQAVKACPNCQKAGNRVPREPLRPSVPSSWPFRKIYIDIQHMPSFGRSKYLAEAREDLTGFVVAAPIANWR